jgi:hypothetical protein
MQRYRTATLGVATVLALGLAMILHEAAHVLVGRLAGGSPTLMTATEVKGDFGSLSAAGFVAFGVAGSVVNVLLCVLGWWLLRRQPVTAAGRASAWFLFAINGMLVTTKMMVEPVAGFGDWMTVLRPLPATDVLRVLVTLLGTGATAFLVRRTGAALAWLVPPGEPSERKAEARRMVGVGALAAAVLVLGSCVASPVGATRGILLALGAGLGPFIPMLFGTRFVDRSPAPDIASPQAGGWGWSAAAATVVLATWFVFGPGVAL